MKQLQPHLSDVLQQYRIAVDISPLPMLLASVDGEMLCVNELLADLFGYSIEELTGQPVELLIPAAHRHRHVTLRSNYFNKPEKRSMGIGMELSGLTRHGETIALELDLDIVSIDRSQYALVTALDIRPRKQQEQHANIAMNAAVCAMITVDAKGQITFVNNASCLLFGYTKDELVGAPVEILVPDAYRKMHPGYRNGYLESSEAREMAVGLDLFARHKSGYNIPVEIALTPVKTQDGDAVVATVVDLTQSKLADKAMQKKNTELETANDSLNQFAFGASHDLKAPLATMAGLLDLSLDDLDSNNIEELRENLLMMQGLARRSMNKVEAVLEIARVDTDNSTLIPEVLELEQVIQEIWFDLTGVNSSKIELQLDINVCDKIVIETAIFKLILENLLSNAVRYTDKNKPLNAITITASKLKKVLHVSVKDNGIGIPIDQQHHVFEMFKKCDERSNDGLGLALVKKQVERMQGSIEFSSTPGIGTEFCFVLPLH